MADSKKAEIVRPKRPFYLSWLIGAAVFMAAVIAYLSCDGVISANEKYHPEGMGSKQLQWLRLDPTDKEAMNWIYWDDEVSGNTQLMVCTDVYIVECNTEGEPYPTPLHRTNITVVDPNGEVTYLRNGSRLNATQLRTDGDRKYLVFYDYVSSENLHWGDSNAGLSDEEIAIAYLETTGVPIHTTTLLPAVGHDLNPDALQHVSADCDAYDVWLAQ